MTQPKDELLPTEAHTPRKELRQYFFHQLFERHAFNDLKKAMLAKNIGKINCILYGWADAVLLTRATSGSNDRVGWQPIETCPKEERVPVHLYQARKHWNEEFVAFWLVDDGYDDGGHWFISDGKHEHPLRGDCITHWKPLTGPPAALTNKEA